MISIPTSYVTSSRLFAHGCGGKSITQGEGDRSTQMYILPRVERDRKHFGQRGPLIHTINKKRFRTSNVTSWYTFHKHVGAG